MAVLLQLGLFLYFGLHFSSAFPTNHNDNCMVFDKVFITTNPDIKASSDVFKSNTTYTVRVPVNDNIGAVVLRAVDKNNNSVGLWQKADKECNDSSALYNVTHLKDTLFRANWIVSDSEDITEVELQIFTVYHNHTATFSSLTLGRTATPTTLMSTTKISWTNQTMPTTTMTTDITTAMTTTMTTAMTTTMTTPMTTTKTSAMTTTKSLAIRALSSPTAGAIHILLVFLTSKLLF